MTTTKEKSKKPGNQPLKESEIDLIFRKLEPYLMTGLSLSRAISKAEVTRSTVYQLYGENKEFANRIKGAQAYFTVTVNDVISLELKSISEKQDINNLLSRDDRQFVQWIANTNKQMRKYYGNDKGKDEEPDRQPAYLKDTRSIKTILMSYECYRNTMIKDGIIKPDGSFTENSDQLIEEMTKKSQVQY